MSARGAFLRGLGLGLLCVSQPLYSLVTSQPDFFAARGSGDWNIVAVGLLAALPALLWGAAAALTSAEALSVGAAAALLTGQACAGLPDRKSTRLNSSHIQKSRMPSSA